MSMTQEHTRSTASDRLREQSAVDGETATGYLKQGWKKMGDMERQAEDYVRRRPVSSVIVAAGAGALLGYVLSRWR
jgi:ElaB/YqjD/DUF883 family membrane-anchored ribosome-binding protein